MRVWLHKWEGNESGWSAWCLDYLGFATWASSRDEVLRRIPGKFDEYRQWLKQHGSVIADTDAKEIMIIEEVSGNEVAFKHDLDSAQPVEISRCLALLQYSRQDLLASVRDLPDAVLDWNPPYRQFAEWAWWHTIRQILKHLAVTEIGYYLPKIGYTGPGATELVGDDWRQELLLSRRETERFLATLSADRDAARVTRADEVWSVRKVLRRVVWHEVLHWKSIERIIRAYDGPMNTPI